MCSYVKDKRFTGFCALAEVDESARATSEAAGHNDSTVSIGHDSQCIKTTLIARGEIASCGVAEVAAVIVSCLHTLQSLEQLSLQLVWVPVMHARTHCNDAEALQLTRCLSLSVTKTWRLSKLRCTLRGACSGVLIRRRAPAVDRKVAVQLGRYTHVKLLLGVSRSADCFFLLGERSEAVSSLEVIILIRERDSCCLLQLLLKSLLIHNRQT